MTNHKTFFESIVPLTPLRLSNFLRYLMGRVVIERSVVDELHLMATGSDITSYIGVNDLVNMARVVNEQGHIFIEDDADPTLKGGLTTAIRTWCLYNPGTDVSVCFGWIDKGTSTVYYKELEMYVDYSANKVKLANAFYKSL